MFERNRCTESMCRGFCCENTAIEITQSERTRLFPKAIPVKSINGLKDLEQKRIPGTFYTKYSREGLKGRGFFLLFINGPCPNRLPNGSCAKHDEREYAARNFNIGCKDCNDIRAEHKIPPIFVEPVK